MKIKLINGDKFARRTLEDSSKFEDVAAWAAELHPEGAFTLYYKDDEGDAITFSSTEELREAERVGAKDGLLRVWVYPTAVPPPAALVESDSESEYCLVKSATEEEFEAAASDLLAELEGSTTATGGEEGFVVSEAESDVTEGFADAQKEFGNSISPTPSMSDFEAVENPVFEASSNGSAGVSSFDSIYANDEVPETSEAKTEPEVASNANCTKDTADAGVESEGEEEKQETPSPCDEDLLAFAARAEEAKARKEQEAADKLFAEKLELEGLKESVEAKTEKKEKNQAKKAPTPSPPLCGGVDGGGAVAQLLFGMLGNGLSAAANAAAAEAPASTDEAEAPASTKDAGGAAATATTTTVPGALLKRAVLELLKDPAVVEALQGAIASAPVRDLVTKGAAKLLESSANDDRVLGCGGIKAGLFAGIVLPELPSLLPVLAELLTKAPSLVTTLGPALVAHHLASLDQGHRPSSAPCQAEAPTPKDVAHEAPPQQQAKAEKAAVVVHSNVLCDGCTGPKSDSMRSLAKEAGWLSSCGHIAGPRYKSVTIEDFDLCSSCEADGRYDATHGPFLKIKSPAQSPEAIFCVPKAQQQPPPPQQGGGGKADADSDWRRGRHHNRGHRVGRGGGGGGRRGGWRQRAQQQREQQWRDMKDVCMNYMQELSTGARRVAEEGDKAAKQGINSLQAMCTAIDERRNEAFKQQATPASKTKTQEDLDLAKAIEASLSPTPLPRKIIEKEAEKKENDEEILLEIDARKFSRAHPRHRLRNFYFVDGPGGWVEYDLELPYSEAKEEEEVRVRIDVKHNARDSRPLKLIVDGRAVHDEFAAQVTGDFWDVKKLQWFEHEDATIALPTKKKTTTLRLETQGFFPHVAALRITKLGASEKKEEAAAATMTTTPPSEQPKEAAKEEMDEVELAPYWGEHRTTICDGCHGSEPTLLPLALENGHVSRNATILGLRYQSQKLRDFDLCKTCKDAGKWDNDAYEPFMLVKPPCTSPMPPKAKKKKKETVQPPLKKQDDRSLFQRTVDAAVAAPQQLGTPKPSAPPAPKTTTTRSKTKTHVVFIRAHLVPEDTLQYKRHNIISAKKGATALLLEGDLKNGLGGEYKDYIKVQLNPPSRYSPRGGESKIGKVSRHLVKLIDSSAAPPSTAPPPKQQQQQQQQQPAPGPVEKKVEVLPRAQFVKDVTIMDGTAVAPGARFQKVWRLKNPDSERAWPAGTRITNVGGVDLGCPAEGVLVDPAEPGQETDIKLNLRAPHKAGRATGYWRLITPGGRKFGHRIWIDIRVDTSLPTPPQPSLPAPSTTSKFELQIQLLQGMGFSDRAQCEAALETEGGDMQRAVHQLLNNPKA